MLKIPGRRQKNRRHQVIPTIPGFVDLLEEHATQSDWVFDPKRRQGSDRLTVTQVKRVISAIGETAGIVVNEDGKTAAAHDLRRSFGQRLANAGVAPRDLQKIMRHASITTTETYYLNDDAIDVGDRIANKLEEGHNSLQRSRPTTRTA